MRIYLTLFVFFLTILLVFPSPPESSKKRIHSDELNYRFLEAVINNEVDYVVDFIEQGYLIDFPDDNGNSALMFAISSKNRAMVNILLGAGADVHSYNADSVSVFMRSLLTGDEVIIKAIMQRLEALDVNEQDMYENDLLMYALMGNFQPAGLFLLNNFDYAIDHTNKLKQSALMLAVEAGDSLVTAILLERGADPNLQDSKGLTSLMMASAWGQFYIADMLLFYGADVNLKAKNGTTALHLASWYGQEALSGLLLDAGALLDARDNRGFTPVMLAVKAADPIQLWYLVESGADLSLLSPDGFSLLGLAASVGDTVSINLLKSYEFKEPATIRQGRRARSVAMYTEDATIINTLENYPGSRPVWLYPGYLTAKAQLNLDAEDRMYGFSVGMYELKYRLLVDLGWENRLGNNIIHQEVSPHFTYQFYEKRMQVFTSVQHLIPLSKNPKHELGSSLGCKLGYSWGSFRGTGLKPDAVWHAAPMVGMYYRNRFVVLNMEYVQAIRSNPNIPTSRLTTGVMLRAPFRKPRPAAYISLY